MIEPGSNMVIGIGSFMILAVVINLFVKKIRSRDQYADDPADRPTDNQYEGVEANDLIIIDHAYRMLCEVCKRHNVADSHGPGHAMSVWANSVRAIKVEDTDNWPKHRSLAIQLAALLHDVDDRKYFEPDSTNAENILYEVLATLPAGECESVTDEVLEMISYVSASSNGNEVPERAYRDPEFLIPRYADRLEAIGWIGIKRCYDYGNETDRVLFTFDTPRPTTEDEVWEAATAERFAEYQKRKSSVSFIDHFYDKLLHIGTIEGIDNTYLREEARQRIEPMIEFCIKFGCTGEVDLNWVRGVTSE